MRKNSNMSKILPPIYIAGPTASGKSALAVKLASKFDSVIISADSMQIYRTLDIGTAKEDISIREKIPHKLIDVVDPNEEFSVAEFARLAKTEIENAQNSGKLPIIVGGTGLYFEALLYPMSFANTNKTTFVVKAYSKSFKISVRTQCIKNSNLLIRKRQIVFTKTIRNELFVRSKSF